MTHILHRKPQFGTTEDITKNCEGNTLEELQRADSLGVISLQASIRIQCLVWNPILEQELP